MLKFLFWLLIAANGALVAFRMGYLDSLLPTKKEPQRVASQINASKVRLVPAKPAAPSSPASAPTPVAASVSASTAAPASLPTKAEAAPAAAKPQKIVACTEVGDFTASEARQFEPLLAPLALGDRQSRRDVPEIATHMVYIPPQGSKEKADKRAAELKKLGVTNFFIIQDNSKMRWGISMGVFKTEAAAKTHLERLKRQGVRSARVGARSISGHKIAYVLRDLDPASLAALDKVMADFPNQRARECGRD